MQTVGAYFKTGFDVFHVFFSCRSDGQENEEAGERVSLMEDSL